MGDATSKDVVDHAMKHLGIGIDTARYGHHASSTARLVPTVESTSASITQEPREEPRF
jgi:hypothetical protein